jgi:DUF1365 family protein
VGLNSCLYECAIVHRRLQPKSYVFEHRMMMLYADLDELDAIDRGTRLLSRERRNLYSFRDADYFPTGTAGGLKSRVAAFLRERGVDVTAALRIRLLTLPRILGYIFNPISIYFCSDGQDVPLCAIAEVGNTFHESKLFLLPSQASQSQSEPVRYRLTTSRLFPASTSASTSTSACPARHCRCISRTGMPAASCSTATCAARACCYRISSCCVSQSSSRR